MAALVGCTDTFGPVDPAARAYWCSFGPPEGASNPEHAEQHVKQPTDCIIYQDGVPNGAGCRGREFAQ